MMYEYLKDWKFWLCVIFSVCISLMIINKILNNPIEKTDTYTLCLGHCIGVFKYINYTYGTNNKIVENPKECRDYCMREE